MAIKEVWDIWKEFGGLTEMSRTLKTIKEIWEEFGPREYEGSFSLGGVPIDNLELKDKLKQITRLLGVRIEAKGASHGEKF